MELAQGHGKMSDHEDLGIGFYDEHLQGKIEYYYVMWITRKDEISYRAGVGRVLKSAWDAAPKKLEKVMLG